LAISKERKQQIVEELTELLKASQGVILTDYRGLNVNDMMSLRRKLSETGAIFKVVKNTLTKLALEQAGLPVPEDMLEGPTAIAFLKDDIAGPAKTLLDFAKETGIPTVKGGLLGKTIMDAKATSDLAKLPPRDVLLAQLVAAIQGPMANLASILMAPMRDLVYVLQARAEGEAEVG